VFVLIVVRVLVFFGNRVPSDVQVDLVNRAKQAIKQLKSKNPYVFEYMPEDVIDDGWQAVRYDVSDIVLLGDVEKTDSKTSPYSAKIGIYLAIHFTECCFETETEARQAAVEDGETRVYYFTYKYTDGNWVLNSAYAEVYLFGQLIEDPLNENPADVRLREVFSF